MVRFVQSIFVSSVALLASFLLSNVNAADEPLPWNGLFEDLKVTTIKKKYLTHILTDRKVGKVDPDQWLTITPNGRSPAYNGDTGVATLAVDSEAIFHEQNNFRRSELVQNVAGNTKGTTFFRVSLMKEVAFVNLKPWQVIFPESHLFELRIDASVDPVKLIWYTGGGTETRWSTEFKIKTWYNFGIAVSSGNIDLYFSEGDDVLALAKTQSYSGDVPTNYEFHFGQLTLSDDGSPVKMVEGKQDVLSFNGVSVEDKIPTDIGSSTPSSKESTTPATTSTSTTPAAASKTADVTPTDTPSVTATDTPSVTATDTPTTNSSPTTSNVIADDDKPAATTLGSDASKTKNCKIRQR
ncbi:unnamed protein product [Peronospora farinosa]|uniref:Glycoside hydrolase 131 catalytic N-terminal domain-containing protein n=1 Tax=Peronospora farinosa TaxID=134698 RepID=A0ABN8CE41_9STRA|nr:unnamed protein product [Peronospora farinosa]